LQTYITFYPIGFLLGSPHALAVGGCHGNN